MKNHSLISKIALLLFFINFFTEELIKAQSPAAFNYQAVLRNGSGEIRENENVDLLIELLQGIENNTAIFSETHTANTNFFGLVNLIVGSQNPVDFELLDWSSGPFFIRVSVEGQVMGISQLMSVPFALHAQTAENVQSVVSDATLDGTGNSGSPLKLADNAVTESKIATGAVTSAKIAQGGATSGQVLKWNGLMWSPADDIDGSGNDAWESSGSNIYRLTGNVGIGTATPPSTFTVGSGNKFQVQGNTGSIVLNDPMASLRFPATASTNAPMIQMFSAGTQNNTRMVISHSSGFPLWGLEYNDTLDVFHFRSNSQKAVTINLATGRLGVNVENPVFPLDIKGRMRISSTGNLNNSPGIWFSNQANTFNRAFLGMARPDSAIGIFSQHMNKWAIEFELMREPRIGINTRGLIYSTANGQVRSELHIGHTNFGGSNDGIRFENEGPNGHYWNIYTSNTTGAFELYKQGIRRVSIDPASGAYTQVSDRRLKQNIIEIAPELLSKIMQLEPSRYQYKAIKGDEGGIIQSDRYNYGFMAQDVEKIFPELVYKGADNPQQEFYHLDYSGFGVIAIKAIQEQQKIIEKQETEIRDMKNTHESEIRDMKNRLDLLEELIKTKN
jgi:hypothetical protein